MEKFIILDTETTGLKPPIGICEIAWLEVSRELEVLSKFDALVNPELPIQEGAEGVHGISAEMVQDEPTADKLPFPEGEICLICHNVGYDKPLVEEFMNITSTCDTLVLARRLLKESENHQLSTLQAYCELPKTLAHRAPGDVQTVLELLKYLVEGTGWSLQQLIDYSNKPMRLTHVGFGKHKGKKFSELPKGYLRWMKEQRSGDWDIDITYTLGGL